MSKDSADFVSLIFGTLSTVSWSIAQLPQQYTNYENKSCDGISFHFLLLWFLGDLTSLIGGILTNQLKFQIYLATYFLYNDFILLFQWIYYTFIYNTVPPSNDSSSSIYLDIGNDSPNDVNNNNNKNDDEDNNNDNDNDPNDDTNDSQNQKLTYIDGIPLTHGDDDIEYYKDSKKYNGKDEDSHDDQDERDEQDEQEPITGSSIGKSAKSSLLKTMLASSISLSSVSNAFPITQILELSSSTASTDQYITTMAEQFKDGSSSPSYKLGRIIAWCCTFIYLSSRIPQLYKNYQRKSVSGINCILFASAVIGNLTYTLSILSSSDFIYNSNKLKFFLNELPYILGSSGTIIFDLIYFYQRSLFGVNSSDIDKDELVLSNSIISSISGGGDNNNNTMSESLSNNLDTYSESDQQQNFDGFDYNENNLSKSLILLINENKNNSNDEIMYRGEVINIKKHKKNLNLINKKISKNKLIDNTQYNNITNPNESTPLI